MIALLAPQLPIAFLAARHAVARARRGEVPDWRPHALPLRAGILDGEPQRFASADAAQLWFEWRRYGRSLPTMVAIVLPFELAYLSLVRGTTALFWYGLVGTLLTPPFLAVFAAAAVRRSAAAGGDAYQLPAFLATKPISSGALVAARLRAALWSACAAWVVVLVGLPVGLKLTGTAPLVSEPVLRAAAWLGPARAITVALLLSALLLAITWKQLVQGLYVGLSGRDWIVKASVFGTLAALVILGPVVNWLIGNDAALTALWDALPRILAVLVTLKLVASAWLVTKLYHRRLLADRTLVAGAAAWSLAVLVLGGVLAWLVSAPHFPLHVLIMAAMLAVPLARIAGAPLALAGNRHR